MRQNSNEMLSKNSYGLPSLPSRDNSIHQILRRKQPSRFSNSDMQEENLKAGPISQQQLMNQNFSAMSNPLFRSINSGGDRHQPSAQPTLSRLISDPFELAKTLSLGTGTNETKQNFINDAFKPQTRMPPPFKSGLEQSSLFHSLVPHPFVSASSSKLLLQPFLNAFSTQDQKDEPPIEIIARSTDMVSPNDYLTPPEANESPKAEKSATTLFAKVDDMALVDMKKERQVLPTTRHFTQRQSARIKAQVSKKQESEPIELKVQQRQTQSEAKSIVQQKKIIRRGRRALPDELYFKKGQEKMEKYKALLDPKTLSAKEHKRIYDKMAQQKTRIKQRAQQRWLKRSKIKNGGTAKRYEELVQIIYDSCCANCVDQVIDRCQSSKRQKTEVTKQEEFVHQLTDFVCGTQRYD